MATDPIRDPLNTETLAKVLLEAHSKWSQELLAQPTHAPMPSHRDMFIVLAEAAIRALAPASEVGDTLAARRLFDRLDKLDFTEAAECATAIRILTDTLATERAAASSEALERAAQVAESRTWADSTDLISSTARSIAHAIRALIPAPPEPEQTCRCGEYHGGPQYRTGPRPAPPRTLRSRQGLSAPLRSRSS